MSHKIGATGSAIPPLPGGGHRASPPAPSSGETYTNEERELAGQLSEAHGPGALDWLRVAQIVHARLASLTQENDALRAAPSKEEVRAATTLWIEDSFGVPQHTLRRILTAFLASRRTARNDGAARSGQRPSSEEQR